MIKKIVAIIFLVSFNVDAATPKITPDFKSVKLTEFTKLVLGVFPDAGTQLVFPFTLDNPDLSPTLKIKLTNANGFDVPTTNNDLKLMITGQNTLTIIGKVNENAPSAKYIGNLFINIGGYHLSILLKTTHKASEHVSNIVFDIDESERLHMIESTIKKHTKELDIKYQNRLKDLDQMAMDKSLSKLAAFTMMDYKTTNFKEDTTIKIDESNIDIFVDKLQTYENVYDVLFLEIDNNSNKDFKIEGIDISIIEDKNKNKLIGSYFCDASLEADTSIKCRFTTTKINMGSARKINISLRTNRGIGEYEW